MALLHYGGIQNLEGMNIFFNQCNKRLMLILMNSSSKLNLLLSICSFSSENFFSGEHCNSVSSRD